MIWVLSLRTIRRSPVFGDAVNEAMMAWTLAHKLAFRQSTCTMNENGT